jgi:hypothetical protein
MYATLKRRLERMEGASGVHSGKPRKILRIVVRRLDRIPSVENATCSRTLCPDGTLLEMVRLDLSRDGHAEGSWRFSQGHASLVPQRCHWVRSRRSAGRYIAGNDREELWTVVVTLCWVFVLGQCKRVLPLTPEDGSLLRSFSAAVLYPSIVRYISDGPHHE